MISVFFGGFDMDRDTEDSFRAPSTENVVVNG